MKTSSFALFTNDRRLLSFAAAAALSLLLGTSAIQAQTSGSPTPAATVATTSPTPEASTKADLLAVAKAAGNFQTLLKALDAAGLTGTLQKPGPFTVFAPTDAAFAKLPAGTLDNLLKPENKAQLVALLSYHVAPAKYTAADLTKLDEVRTLEGTEVDIETSTDGKTIEVDEGKIAGASIEAANGIIHPLDTVLQP